MVAVRRGQLTRQHIRADDCQAGAQTSQWRRTVCRIAQQRHPTLRPVLHAHLSDQIEVKVRGTLHRFEQTRRLPLRFRKDFANKLLLLRRVSALVSEWRREKTEHGLRCMRTIRSDTHRLAAWSVVDHEPAVGVHLLWTREVRGVGTEWVDESGLLTKRQRAHTRMHAVRTDHHV